MAVNKFLFYLTQGWEHIVSLEALDHQLFLLALMAVYTYRNLKQAFILLATFIFGYSLTLLISVLYLIHFQTKWIAFLIPCTIFITSLANLFKTNFYKRTVNRNYYFALFFGMIHGMGFADFIRMTLAKEQNMGWGLFGFNLGLGFGQLFFVIAVLVVTFIVFDFFRLRQREWVIFLSASVFSLALKMALERIPI